MLAIEMVGGVYCPLSPQDPQYRLHELIQQTQSCLVLTHFLTTTKCNGISIVLDIDSVLVVNDMKSDVDLDQLSSVQVTSDSKAYIIFTSGSTGTPKAVSIDANQLLIIKATFLFVLGPSSTSKFHGIYAFFDST